MRAPVNVRRGVLAVAGIGLLLASSACSSDDSSSTPPTTRTLASQQSEAPDLSAYPALPAPAAPASATVSCTYAPAGQASKQVQPPSTDGVSTAGTVGVAMATTQGPIGLTLDRAEAPCTVNSFVSLTEQGYFDDTPCHRLVTSPGLQVLQCGDPSGAGNGGPGYRFANEYPTTAFAEGDPAAQEGMLYPRGTIAMANSGPGGTNGSQFFLVYEDSVLPPQYTVFGTITDEGLATIEKIAADGDDGSMSAGGGKPNTPVQIETVKVS
ncbi:peptidylprolyl isomerase [Rhodococcus oryzae]|uniref:Peptidylprolyl isomerase n=1 Tax=Rhodococcus oryzae TaxID=2571143 RepID=A0ABY2RKE3_9NOCA|nr:peptidylprolyl isomerase [Rhodococcus oryzae]TJZ78227.1 peptidylprolyl isomerase [Rhodococcus oryzae]